MLSDSSCVTPKWTVDGKHGVRRPSVEKVPNAHTPPSGISGIKLAGLFLQIREREQIMFRGMKSFTSCMALLAAVVAAMALFCSAQVAEGQSKAPASQAQVPAVGQARRLVLK